MTSFASAYSDRIATAEETSDSPPADEEPGDRGRDSHEAYATEKLAVRSPASAHYRVWHFGLRLLTSFSSVIDVVDERMEHISKKIDDLTEIMSRLSSPAHPTISHTTSPASPWPSSTASQAPGTGVQESDRSHCQVLTETDAIEQNVFSQAVFATKFLQAILANDPFSSMASEIASVLDTLRDVTEAQNRRNNAHDISNPFSKSRVPGHGSRDLPIPPTGKIMACLRMAKDDAQVQSYALLLFKSLGNFVEYVIKACSPGPITDAELIIVHLGLYWLFYECSDISTDANTKQDYATQAFVCKDSLEIVLSNLSIHAPANMDYVHAMYLAASTQISAPVNKPIAAWTFLSKASLLAQAMGIHDGASMASEPTEEKEYRIRIFWALYCLEKATSLRLGRSSTIRDDDVTVPRPLPEQMMKSPWQRMLLDSIEISNLYGRVFDHLYSPSARMQLASVRTSRARALAEELERKMASKAASFIHGQESLGHLLGPRLLQFLQHADKAPNYSVLASIYKSVSSPESSGSSSCPECVSASRTALQEHVACISLAAESEFQCITVEFLINAALLLLPFIPFSILFCNIIETSDLSDLQHLGRFIEALKSLYAVPRYSKACSRQLPIFKALYEVAAKYVEVKSKAWQSGLSINDGLAGQAIETSLGNESVRHAHPVGLSRESDGSVATLVEAEPQQAAASNASRNLADETETDFGMEMDLSSAEIGDWFYHSQQMMRLLEDG
ncbi:hypothetical protein NM208_g3173 [Fusarium decemcellulare]|uniref:Uncharacterized protein n=1 Tax=Fusarium decemcellulare TaxID=57161 RepID=A0ACC1SPX5_9HYPO|nr:hypothetical protein NM208_g3173 [Fusarium decemcellulare]